MGDPPAASAADVGLRDQLSSLQGLLVLSMLMTERDDEQQILHLASTSVPSLGPYRLAGVFVADEGWRAARDRSTGADVRADLEAQFAVLSTAGGPVAILQEAWGWAFGLRSLEGDFGFLVVAADEEPSAGGQFLLRVLAQQTGVALANARLHQRQRATAEELRSSNAELAATVAALEQSTAIHDRLTQVAVAGEGQEGIARAVHELTGYPVAVEDRYGNLLSWAGPDQPEPYPKDERPRRAELMARAQLERQPVRDGWRLLEVASPDDDVLGVLVLVDPAHTAGAPERVALEHGATVLAMELARLRGLAETELRLGRDLVEQLLTGADERDTLSRAQAQGYDLERPHRVVVVACTPPTPDDTFFHAVRRAARDQGVASLLIARRDTVVVLPDAERSWEGFREAVGRESGGHDCRIGVGSRCDRPADFPRSYHEAQLALRMQDAAGRGVLATVFDDLGVYRVLAAVEDTAGVERFVREWLGALIDYDSQRKADLVATLSRYLECGRAQDATAKALEVHRNTVKYRLQRIGEISGHDLADPDVSFNLQLAARAWHTLGALRGGAA